MWRIGVLAKSILEEENYPQSGLSALMCSIGLAKRTQGNNDRGFREEIFWKVRFREDDTNARYMLLWSSDVENMQSITCVESSKLGL